MKNCVMFEYCSCTYTTCCSVITHQWLQFSRHVGILIIMANVVLNLSHLFHFVYLFYLVFSFRAKHRNIITLEATYPYRITTSAQLAPPTTSLSEAHVHLLKSTISTTSITPPPTLIRLV